jgi:hypothetical protein
MLYAADLINDYDEWTDVERNNFKTWWMREVIPFVLDDAINRKNNFKDSGILGVITAGIVFEDSFLVNAALEQLDSYFNGEWKIKQDYNGTYLPAEVIRNDGESGMSYTAYAMTSTVQSLDMARYIGYNYWQRSTTEGANIKDLIQQYFKWDILDEGFPWNDNPLIITNRRNVYEIANNHYYLMDEMRSWIKDNRPLKGEQGDEWVTLNKGDIKSPYLLNAENLKEEIKVYAIEDTWVGNDVPDEPQGKHTQLSIRRSLAGDASEMPKDEMIRKVFIKFDLNNVKGEILSAKLYYNYSNFSNRTISFHAVDDNSWSEDTLIWRNRPFLGAELIRKEYPGSGNSNMLIFEDEGIDITDYIRNQKEVDDIVTIGINTPISQKTSLSDFRIHTSNNKLYPRPFLKEWSETLVSYEIIKFSPSIFL